MCETHASPPTARFVLEGRDGWLFLQGGSNFVTSLYQREGGQLPDSMLLTWRDAIVARARQFARLAIAWFFVVVPEKLTIYEHRTATSLIDADNAPALRLYEQLNQIGESGSRDADAPAPRRVRLLLAYRHALVAGGMLSGPRTLFASGSASPRT